MHNVQHISVYINRRPARSTSSPPTRATCRVGPRGWRALRSGRTAMHGSQMRRLARSG